MGSKEQSKEIWVREFCDTINNNEWIWCEQNWWRYNKDVGVWQPKDQEVMDYCYFRWCDAQNNDAKEYHSDAMKRLKAKLYSRTWKELETPGYINFKNGVFHQKTKEFMPHEAMLYSREQLSIDYSPGATPYWDQVWGAYHDQIDLFERAMHAVLLKNHNDEAMIFGVGPTGSGKGTISQIIQACFGNMVSYLKLNAMGKDFMLSTLVGKRINLDREGEIGYLNGLAVAYLKDIVTHEGPILINPKRKTPFEADLDIWFFTFLNQLYQLPSGTDRKALFRRVVVLEFDKTMPKNPGFKEGVMQETAQIISNICQRDFEPLFPVGMDVDAYVKHIAERWDYWSQPIRRVLGSLFEYSDQPLDDLEVKFVVDVVDEQLRIEGITERQDQLKGKITMYLGVMGIHKRQKNREPIYYNIRAKADTLKERLSHIVQIEEAEREGGQITLDVDSFSGKGK